MHLHRLALNSLAWALLAVGAGAQPSFTEPIAPKVSPVSSSVRPAAYQKRVKEVLDWRAALVKPEDPKSGGLAEVAAQLALRRDAEWCSRKVTELMKEPGGDMFWMFPVTCIAYLGRDQLSEEAKAAIREAWRTYMPMRGDTENHWAMYYTSLYLMAQLWPGEAGGRWFSGKTSEENLRESREYLLHWMDLTTTVGQGEYDCTHYIGEYAIPMLYLSAWADDPAMRIRGRMMLDWILADYAADSLNGLYVGAHARTNEAQLFEKWNGLSSFFGWLLFGNCPPPAGYGGWGVYFAAAASHYEMPEVIYRIATDRASSYTEIERKRTRHRWRNSDVRNAPVYKTTHITADYAIGSDQGGLLQPIQQHSWDVTWAVPDPRGVHNTLFSAHAYHSAFEMQMYFNDLPDYMPEAVTFQGKPTYNKEDRFLGGSPHEQIFQKEDALICLYDIPQGTRFGHVNGFFSKDLSRLEEDASGWIFAEGGNAWIAYRPLSPYEWKSIKGGGRRLFSPHLKNGAVVQVASRREFPSWEAFKQRIRELPLEIALEPRPRVRFTGLRGKTIECTYGESPKVDGRTVDFEKEWKLFDSPYLQAEKGGRKLVLMHERLERVLDFNTLQITDRVRE